MIKERVSALQNLLKEKNISALIIPTDDFHMSEYVGDYFKARNYFSGFTGSAGVMVVAQDEANLWVDGRYFIQAEKQLENTGIIQRNMGEPGVPTVEEYINSQMHVMQSEFTPFIETHSETPWNSFSTFTQKSFENFVYFAY